MIHKQLNGDDVKLEDQVPIRLPFSAPSMILTKKGIEHSIKLGEFIVDNYDIESEVIVRADSSSRTQMTGVHILKVINNHKKSSDEGRIYTPVIENDPLSYSKVPALNPMTIRHAYWNLFKIEHERQPVADILEDIYKYKWIEDSALDYRLKTVGQFSIVKTLANIAIFEYLKGSDSGRLNISTEHVKQLAKFASDCVEMRVSPEVIEKRCGYLIAYIKHQLSIPNRLTIIVSHDTNIHGLVRLLGIEDVFQIDQWPRTYVPPTSGMVLEPNDDGTVKLSSIGIGCNRREEMTSNVIRTNLVLPETDDKLLEEFSDSKDCLCNYV